MKVRTRFLVAVTVTILVLRLALAQQGPDEIGFGQSEDSVLEGAADLIDVRRLIVGMNVSGRIVPLTLRQYRNYTFDIPRTVSETVEMAINSTTDEAEDDDFNSVDIDFTVYATAIDVDVSLRDVINRDDVNEAREQLVLVLEPDSEDMNFDEFGGVLVLTILDANPIALIINVSTLMFNESAVLENVVVQKQNSTLETEVIIPVLVLIQSLTVTIGEDITTTNYSKIYNIPINATEVPLDKITIVDDNVPETEEEFTLSLGEHDGDDDLSLILSDSVVTLTILDDDEAQIGFTQSEYSVIEGEDVEICITVTNGISLDSSLGYANFTLNLSSSSASVLLTPDSTVLTIKKEQEIACVNITVMDDLSVEERDVVNVSLALMNFTFYAGVNITRETAAILIDDNDGAIVGFAMSSYKGSEGDTIKVCVTIHSPNETILSMSSVAGRFEISGSAGNDINTTTTSVMLTATTISQCFNVYLENDALVEGTETVTLSLKLMESDMNFGIRDIAPNTTNIIITDDDFAVIGFTQSEYNVTEENSPSVVNVCVQLINGTIAENVSVVYNLIFDNSQALQDTDINSTRGNFTTGTDKTCHKITVQSNTVVEIDGIVSVNISDSTYEPYYNISDTRAYVVIHIINNDILTVNMAISSNSLMEGATATLSVSYTGILHQHSTVICSITTTPSPSSSEDGAIALQDYSISTPHTFTLTSVKQQEDFIVQAIDDNIFEDRFECFTISISLDNLNIMAILEEGQRQSEVTIEDNEVLTFEFQMASYTFDEDSGLRSFYVILQQYGQVIIPKYTGVTVSVGVTAEIIETMSNATRDEDYIVNTVDVSYDNDTLSHAADMRINITNDTLVEGHEVLKISLKKPTVNGLNNKVGAQLGDQSSTIVIIRDDDVITVGFNELTTNNTGMEGATINVCVGIFNGTLGPNITLDYLIDAPRTDASLPPGSEPDSAIATLQAHTDDGDYSRTATRVSLNAIDTSSCVTIRLIDDSIVEIDERFLAQVEQIVSSDDLRFPLNPEYTTITIIDDDVIMMGFELLQYQFNESAGSLPDSVYIVRENPVTVSSTFTVTVSLQSHSTAMHGSDFLVSDVFNVSITFAGNDDRQPFPLNILQDEVSDGDETIELLITTPGQLDGVIPGTNSTTTIVIIDDDFIQYRYTQLEYSFNETDNDTQVCLEIVSGNFVEGGYLTLAFFTSNFTATAGVDYTIVTSPSMLNLNNETRISCTGLQITEDKLVEGQEAFEVYFEVVNFFGSYAVNGSDTTMITILDSNVAEVGFGSPLYTVVEGEELMVTVCVLVLSGGLTDVVSLNYSLLSQPQNAAENIDYGPTIYPDVAILNRTSKMSCHSMVIYDDEGVEPPENVSVTIIATGPTLEFINLFDIILPETTVQIVDNDSLSIGFEYPSYIINETSRVLEVCLMFRGPLKSDSFVELKMSLIPMTAQDTDYSDTPVPDVLVLDINNTRRCVSINITDDNIVEGLEIFEVHFNETDNNQINIAGTNTVQVEIEDDEVIELQFGDLTYTFSESAPINHALIEIANYDELDIRHDVTVTVIPLDPANATQLMDYVIVQMNNQVRIPAGKTNASVELNIDDDMIVEGVEYLTLVLSSGKVVMIANGDDAVDTIGVKTTVFIEDNDVATIGFNSTSYTTAEGVVEICVSLMNGDLQSNLNISYSITVTNTTATGDDFSPLTEIGQISKNATKTCHNVTIVDDNLVEESENLQVSLKHVFNVANVLHRPNITTITIEDDDSVFVGFKSVNYSVEEMAGSASLTITIVREDNLTALSDFKVMLNLSSASNASEDIDFSIDGGIKLPYTLFFGASEMTKNITVNSVHDDIGEGDEVIILDIFTDVDNVINVNSFQQTTRITIVEDDMIPVSFGRGRYSVSEGEAVELCVNIDSGNLPTDGFVDFSLSTSPITAIGGSDYTEIPSPSQGTLNENVPTSCFNVTTLSDSEVEGREDMSIQFTFTDRFGSFIPADTGDIAIIEIIDDDLFQLGFEQSEYEIGEGEGLVNDTIYIIKLNENILQMHYNLTISVLHSDGPYPAVLDEDFVVESSPISVTFETVHTRIPISFTIMDDDIEEGYENFTLQLSYNEVDEHGTVQIVTESAKISIKDDDVVVIGFERNAYVVFEGQAIEVCVAVLARNLSNDEDRQFTVATSQLANDAATVNDDYVTILGTTMSISRTTVMRQCFTVETNDDEDEEPPERLGMTGTANSHLIEFNPDTAVIWIVDDDSLFLPVPDISALNCTSVTERSTLTVTCIPPSGSVVAELLCSVDGEDLRSCIAADTTSRKRDVDPHMFTVDLLEYQDGLHVLEIIGLTHVTEILRDTLEFFGLAQPFQLECIGDVTQSGLIEVSCTTERVLESLTCTVDEGNPETCSLKFVIDPTDYAKGPHTVVVTATNLLGETDTYTFTFDAVETEAVSVWKDREFVAAIAIAGVAFIILLLLLLAICLLVFYHRKVNRLKLYGLDLRSENEYVGIGRNLSYRDHDPVELVDYAHHQPEPPNHHPQGPASQQSHSSSARPQSQQSQTSTSRPLSSQSEASTARVSSPEPPAPATFHIPPPPPLPVKQPTKVLVQQQHHEDEKPLLDSTTDPQTEQQLLLPAAASSEGESRGLKISRRHSVETRKETKKSHQYMSDDETAEKAGTFSGRTKVGAARDDRSGAYSIAQGKELQGRDWEEALQREFDEQMARETARDRVRSQERRREAEQRERRRERDQQNREYRAQERRERERAREVAKERRLALDRDPQNHGATPSVAVVESPESFL
jgi:hypothetical protein